MQDLRCTVPEHNKKKFISISLNDQAEKRLFCFQCQSDSTGKLSQSQIMNSNQLSDLDEVMEGNQYTVYNWPCDALGKEIKETLMKYKSPEQQKKDIEDFFVSLKQKLFEQIENIKGLLIETLTSTQFIKDEKKDMKQDEKKDDKKDEKKDTKKDDKKETKKDDKKDTKKDDKKDTKKDDKQELKDQDKVDMTVSVENLKRLYDNVYDLIKIKQLIKENAKSDPKILTDKLSDHLNDQKRKETKIIMKNIYDQFKKSNNNTIGIPINREKLDQFKEQIEKGIAQWPQFFGKLDWQFDISKADDSALIKLIKDGIEFQGGSQKSQIIYSTKQFTEGQHGCVVMFTEFDQRRASANGNFIVGLVSEENKDKGPYGQDLRKCLFTGTGDGIDAKIGTDFNNTFKIAPKILAIKIDIDSDYLEISDGKRSVVYGLEREKKLKGKKWRIYLMWREAADKIKLIHSY